jgi:hypothetical protein
MIQLEFSTSSQLISTIIAMIWAGQDSGANRNRENKGQAAP